MTKILIIYCLISLAAFGLASSEDYDFTTLADFSSTDYEEAVTNVDITTEKSDIIISTLVNQETSSTAKQNKPETSTKSPSEEFTSNFVAKHTTKKVVNERKKVDNTNMILTGVLVPIALIGMLAVLVVGTRMQSNQKQRNKQQNEKLTENEYLDDTFDVQMENDFKTEDTESEQHEKPIFSVQSQERLI